MVPVISNFFSFLGADQADNALNPIYDAITLIGPYAMAIVVALGMVYGTILGVKMAKAEDAKDRATYQKALVNGVIGFVAMLILIAVLYAIRGPLSDWMNS